MNDFNISELIRLLHNIVIVATVTECDREKALVKVEWKDGVKSNWLHCAQLGSNELKLWIPQSVGSQVVVFSPCGDTTQGIVYPGPFATEIPKTNFDGEITGSGNLKISDGNINVTNGDATADEISLKNHTHNHPKGPGTTQKPQ